MDISLVVVVAPWDIQKRTVEYSVMFVIALKTEIT